MTRCAIVTASDSGIGTATAVALARDGHADEIAATVAFLCSDATSCATGASCVVDGGMRLLGPHGGSDLPSYERRSG